MAPWTDLKGYHEVFHNYLSDNYNSMIPAKQRAIFLKSQM